METPDAKEILEKGGVKPSLHRMRILEYIMLKRNHPTADMIYKEISGDIPTLSKTTIYNTLKTLHEKGVVQAITIEENEVRYDATMENHAHLKCTKCGNIYDIELHSKVLTMKSIDGHSILESHLYLKGICKSCLNRI